jgi:hypothetical protein
MILRSDPARTGYFAGFSGAVVERLCKGGHAHVFRSGNVTARVIVPLADVRMLA